MSADLCAGYDEIRAAVDELARGGIPVAVAVDAKPDPHTGALRDHLTVTVRVDEAGWPSAWLATMHAFRRHLPHNPVAPVRIDH